MPDTASAPIKPDPLAVASPPSPASPSTPQASPQGLGDGTLEVGTFEFKWPGGDCWAVYRGEEKVAGSCGGGKQALQAGIYTVKGNPFAVFSPFSVVVKPNAVTTVDANGGLFESQAWAMTVGQSIGETKKLPAVAEAGTSVAGRHLHSQRQSVRHIHVVQRCREAECRNQR